ncbi:MAG: hypothetical protein FJX51_03265 [Alphaproteobacteria bacterium]|nr:hypothetical protein [Alphaproteobacteria bacterium]
MQAWGRLCRERGIVNEVRGVDHIVYNDASKPPGTIDSGVKPPAIHLLGENP